MKKCTALVSPMDCETKDCPNCNWFKEDIEPLNDSVPDKVLLRYERIEKGKLLTQIQELEHKLKELTELSYQERKELKRDKEIAKLKSQNSELRTSFGKLRNENGQYISKLARSGWLDLSLLTKDDFPILLVSELDFHQVVEIAPSDIHHFIERKKQSGWEAFMIIPKRNKK